jgi:cell division control protein 6
MFTSSKRRRTVFEDEKSLSTANLSEPIGREREIDQIADTVRPLSRGQEADNLLVHGPAGTGKTTCINHVLNKLDEQTRVRTVTINCWKYNTRPSLLTQLLIELGYPAPRKGKPIDELLTTLKERVDKGTSIAVGLDEFDQLAEQNEVLYDLHELNVQTENSCGMILASNKSPSEIELEQRTRSRLGYRTLEFDVYGKDDLEEILRNRAVEAFRRNVLGDGVIERVATAVADEIELGQGDCRHALEVLHRAGREADKENADKVTVAHVERAMNAARFGE